MELDQIGLVILLPQFVQQSSDLIRIPFNCERRITYFIPFPQTQIYDIDVLGSEGRQEYEQNPGRVFMFGNDHFVTERHLELNAIQLIEIDSFTVKIGKLRVIVEKKLQKGTLIGSPNEFNGVLNVPIVLAQC